MLCNIHTKQWDDVLLQIFIVPKQILPTIKSSSEIYSFIEINNHKIPIAGIAGDQQAALFGQCCFEEGTIKNTYGTGCFTLLNTGKNPVASHHLLTTIAWTIQNKTCYALEGSVFIGGAAIQWLRDGLHIISHAQETEALAKESTDDELYFVPALSGLGCPYWDPAARGMMIGIRRGTKKEDIIRATLESIAYQTNDVLETITAETGIPISELNVDGGAAANCFLMQFQADISKVTVIVPTNKETTALGVGFLAGLAVGFWNNQKDIAHYWKTEKRYSPQMSDAIREKKYNEWKDAVERCKGWIKNKDWTTPKQN